jgi:hypothetical protein
MPKQPPKPEGKPTVEQHDHDQNVGQRERTGVKQDGAKPSVDEEPGKNYGQREGSTVTEDNDVE